jgi:hypothetical protein
MERNFIMASQEGDLKALEAKANLNVGDTKSWRYSGQKSDGAAVAAYLNTPTVQGAGEAMVSGNLGGPFDVWIYV